jgi:RNA ligase
MSIPFETLAVQAQIEAGFIRRRRHPTEPYTIYNYTEKAQYSHAWTPETRVCRGLILDDDGNVVARPFEKFFNLGETEETQAANLPADAFEVTDNLDGSLGILYRTRDGYAIATRGSFDGEQATWATEYLRTHHNLTGLPPKTTLLFEIIYPANRVVLDYGARAELVLIGARHFDGYDYAHAELVEIAERWHLPVVSLIDIQDAAALAELAATTKGIEGWVLRFPTGLRVKVKTTDYLAIHRARFGLTPARIHEALQLNGLDALLIAVPEEVRPEIEAKARAMLTAAAATQQAVESAWTATVATVGTSDRKAFALHVVKTYPVERAYLFMLLDRRPIDAAILKNVDLRALGMDPEEVTV